MELLIYAAQPGLVSLAGNSLYNVGNLSVVSRLRGGCSRAQLRMLSREVEHEVERTWPAKHNGYTRVGPRGKLILPDPSEERRVCIVVQFCVLCKYAIGVNDSQCPRCMLDLTNEDSRIQNVIKRGGPESKCDDVDENVRSTRPPFKVRPANKYAVDPSS